MKEYSAINLLNKAVEEMGDRGKQRDSPGGERSMGKAVDIFNTLTGHDLDEGEGWLFMIALKLSRSMNGVGVRADDYVDAAAYSALYGEWELKNATKSSGSNGEGRFGNVNQITNVHSD